MTYAAGISFLPMLQETPLLQGEVHIKDRVQIISTRTKLLYIRSKKIEYIFIGISRQDS